jgi:hypothetical protein
VETLRYRLQLESWHGAGNSQASNQASSQASSASALGDMLEGSAHDVFGRWEKRRLRRLLANWDPEYPGEKVPWYHEYIQRCGPTATNWFENPTVQQASVRRLNEVRGLGLYHQGRAAHGNASDAVFAVTPLEDGTVCLFDVGGTLGKMGSIAATSRPGLLFEKMLGGRRGDGRHKLGHAGLTEGVSVDSQGGRAFFAVQGGERCRHPVHSCPWLWLSRAKIITHDRARRS